MIWVLGPRLCCEGIRFFGVNDTNVPTAGIGFPLPSTSTTLPFIEPVTIFGGAAFGFGLGALLVDDPLTGCAASLRLDSGLVTDFGAWNGFSD